MDSRVSMECRFLQFARAVCFTSRTKHSSLGICLLGFASFFLSGCADLELQQSPPPKDLATSQIHTPDSYASAATPRFVNQDKVQDKWIETFQSETLQKLVHEALLANPDLSETAARRDTALARIKVAESALKPHLNEAVSLKKYDQGFGNSDSITLDTQASWEIDLWGKYRADKDAAILDAFSSTLTYEYAKQSLAANVADAWFLIILAKKQLVIDLQQLDVERLTEDIARKRADLGVITQMDQAAAAANVKLAEDAAARSRLSLSEAARSLEILLGRYPAAEIEVNEDLPKILAPIPTGLPSELLERRPDLRAADRQVAAAFYRVNSAKAARLPSISLSASLGAVLNPANEIWSIGANLLAPLYKGGELQAQVEIRKAEQRESLAIYVKTALQAFREVESALATLAVLQEREPYLSEAEVRLNTACSIAQSRYDAGIITIFDLTTVRKQYFGTLSQLLSVRVEQLRQRVRLYLVLGGSFEQKPDLTGIKEATHGN